MIKFDMQLFSTTAGVFPVHNNVFKIGILGRASEAGDMKVIKDLETFSPGVDSNIEEWTPMDQEGWIRRLLTGKGVTFGFTGKRCYGDVGNDYIASLLLSTGENVASIFEWTLPNGDVFTMDCLINMTTPAGGDATNVDSLEFEVLSDGKPEYADAADFAELTFVCSAGAEAGTKIAAVSPVLGDSNSYFTKINGTLPALNDVINSAGGWAAYTLGEDIDTTAGNNIALVEVVTSTGSALKGGISPAVLA